eukprot:4329191-Amphidinium_carterae.1
MVPFEAGRQLPQQQQQLDSTQREKQAKLPLPDPPQCHQISPPRRSKQPNTISHDFSVQADSWTSQKPTDCPTKCTSPHLVQERMLQNLR